MAKTRNSTGTGRTPREGAKLQARRTQAFQLWTEGHVLREIADLLGISTSVAAIDVQLALVEWREHHRGSVNEHAEHELRRLNLIELNAERSFEESKGKKGTEPGNPAFLSLMIDCSKERRKLLGVDQPARTEIKSDLTVGRTFISKAELAKQIKADLAKVRAG